MKGALDEGFHREGGKWEKEDGTAPVYAHRLAFKNGSPRVANEFAASQKGKGGSMKRRVDGERADGHTGSWAGMSRHGRPDQMASGIECGGSASRRTG